ncbi:hypothetical protein [Solihabitans fulvus]|uniref:hypothetical protein n=1 Tax=Solihabitans fulvus TaxID=1892852 RepID=UPI001661EEA7|nr:hypothetical protein [Solihabitans fulvus]
MSDGLTDAVPKAPRWPEPPKLVNLSRWLWIGSAALSAVRSIIQLGDRQQLIDLLRQSNAGLTQDQLDAEASGSVVFGLLLAGALLLLYAFLANRMARGLNWARVVLTVLGGGGLLVGVIGLIGIASGVAPAFGVRIGALDVSLSVLGLLVDAVALTLMYVRGSAGHFVRRR